MVVDMTDDIDSALAIFTALEQGRHGEQLRHLFTPDAVTIEHPNRITPRGATRAIDEIIAGSVAGASLLARQRFDIHHTDVVGDTVIVRLTWTGTVRADAGALTAGQVITAHIASFITVRDGLISRIETFDCYESF